MNWLDPCCPEALRVAKAARQRAYAPYSRFRMGAAVITSDDTVVPGTLVENVSLGLAMCAERVALFSCVASAAGKPEIVALIAPRTQGRLTFPCGACLQVARELGDDALIVVVQDLEGEFAQARLSEIAKHLPHKARGLRSPSLAFDA